MGFNRGKNWTCKDVIKSFNKESDRMKEIAIEDGMKICNEEVSEYGHKMFNAYAPQTWDAETMSHKRSTCRYSRIDCIYFDHGAGKIQGRVIYNVPMPYGHGLEYMYTFDQK